MDDSVEAHTPPPAQPVEAPRQLPSLPTEILQRIIQLALPLMPLRSSQERYDTLRNCCRVNKVWAALGQRELCRHVGLAQVTAANSFIALRRKRRPSLPITSLRLLFNPYRDDSLQALHIGALIASTPGLRVLRLMRAAGGSGRELLDLGALSVFAEDLQELVLDHVSFEPQPYKSPLVAASLRRLSLSFLDDPADAIALLHSAQLPLLESLVILDGCRRETFVGLEPLEYALRRFTPQLKSFTLSFPGTRVTGWELAAWFWQSFQKLRHLTLSHHFPFDVILPSISTPLVRLRLGSTWMADVRVTVLALEKAFQISSKCLETVQEIVIPRLNEEEREEDEHSLRSLSNVCESRGIEFREVSHVAPGDDFAHIEDAIDDW